MEKKYMKRSYLFIFLAFLFLGIFFAFLTKDGADYTDSGQLTFSIGTTTLLTEVVKTPEDRNQGLSGRTSLEPQTGMLFIFEEPGIYPFWMKDMNFPIDMIWIDEQWRIVDISHNISPETYPQTFSSSLPIRYVLEVNAGFSRKNNLLSGMTLTPQKER